MRGLSNMRLTRMTRTGVLAGLLAGAVSVASCAQPDAAAPGAGVGPAGSQVASVAFELTLGGKYQFATVSYDISGNGFHRAASVNVAGSSTISTLVGNVPFGTGYVATLTAQDTAGALTPCTGSATFNVATAGTVAVPVHMSCSLVQPTTGTGGMGGGGAGGAGGSTPPPAVPVPRGAAYALAALLAVVGGASLRRRRRA
jgi:hypothetical protein